MVRSIIINQIVVGYSIWLTNGDGRQLLSATNFDPTSLVVGAAGGLAVIAVGRFIEKSPNPLFAELNLSTNDIKDEGVAALWTGVGPTAGRATALAAAELASYDEAKGQLKSNLGMKDGILLTACTSFISGYVSTDLFKRSPHLA